MEQPAVKPEDIAARYVIPPGMATWAIAPYNMWRDAAMHRGYIVAPVVYLTDEAEYVSGVDIATVRVRPMDAGVDIHQYALTVDSATPDVLQVRATRLDD